MERPLPAAEIDPELLRELERFGFSPALLAEFSRRAQTQATANNTIRDPITPLAKDDVVRLPEASSAESLRLAELGRSAGRRGELGVVVLAGGMATRFGGAVKAAVPALGSHSFFALKYADVAVRAAEVAAAIPVLVMTSHATHDQVLDLVRTVTADPQHHGRVPVECFAQMVSLRLGADGKLFRDAEGQHSPYSTGHGDLTFALRSSGALRRFREGGGRYLCVSNVDNLGATLDWAVVGAHIEAKLALTAEVVRKSAGDRGGAPVRVGGVPQIVEAFRFPPSVDQDAIPLFNTNSFVFDAAAIDRDFPLDYFHVKKEVDEVRVIQFERLVGQLTAHLPTMFLEVPRDGRDGRFQPVKDPDELTRRRDVIRAILVGRGVAV